MSKARYYIPVIATSILSGIVVYPVQVYSIDWRPYNWASFLFIILSFISVIVAILLSLVSGYIFSPSDNNDKYPFVPLFVVATITCLIFSLLFPLIRIYFCESCGTDSLALPFVICLSMLIGSPLVGLCTAFFINLV